MEQPYHLIFEKPEVFKDYYLNDETEPIVYLPNFNTINIIVGANNSGKSRFMRCLFSLERVTLLDQVVFNNYNEVIIEYNNNRNLTNLRELELRDFLSTIEKNNKSLLLNKTAIGGRYKQRFSKLENELLKKEIINKKYYVPTLRTAHSLYTAVHERISNSLQTNSTYTRLDEDIYSETLRKNYSLHDKIEIFTGINLYEEILNSRNAEKNVRDRFEYFERFLSKNFFDGKQIDIVAQFNKADNKQGRTDSESILIHVEGEEKTRKLHDLGDGIQAIIILMYKIFMAGKGTIFFIDEPELNLHPGMQRLFLEQISTNEELVAKELKYIITTHSNHFLDLTLEKNNVSIYSFAPKEVVKGKEPQFVIKNVNRGDNEILKHLGVNNSSVFLANCSIWVEGVSDRNYIKAFLKSYIEYLARNKKEEYKSLKEDIDYAFFEYAGSNIEHYIFEEEISEDEEKKIEGEINALALSNKIFLLADSDNADGRKSKGKRHKRLEESKKENFIPKIIKEVREIENLLTNKMWEQVLINFCNKKLLPKHQEDIQNKISEALKSVNSNNYKKEYIGVFLNEINKEVGKIEGVNVLNKIYQENEGAFIPKRELSEYVLEADLKWDDLQQSDEIKNLTIEIYQFIIGSMN